MFSRRQRRKTELETEGQLQYEVDYHKRSDHVVQPLNFVMGCKSNHSEFVPVDKFTLSDLPYDVRCQEVLDIVRLNIDLAVKVSVKRNKLDGGKATRQDDNEEESEAYTDDLDTNGSGSICYFSDTHNMFPCGHGLSNDTCNKCHIKNCPYSSELGPDHFVVTSFQMDMSEAELSRSHIAFRVSTNQHVVRDERDATNATVELFYHSDDARGVVKARGVCLGEVWEDQDKVHLICVTNLNERVKDLLQTMSPKMRQIFANIPQDLKNTIIKKYVIIVSHPHGTPKVVSVGTKKGSINKQCHDGRRYTETRYTAETCLGSSGAPVVGPGWEDGGPVYRVHCGFFTSPTDGRNKIGLSKSFWIIDSDPRGGAGPSAGLPRFGMSRCKYFFGALCECASGCFSTKELYILLQWSCFLSINYKASLTQQLS